MIRRDGDKEIPEPFADEVIAMCTNKIQQIILFFVPRTLWWEFLFLCNFLYTLRWNID